MIKTLILILLCFCSGFSFAAEPEHRPSGEAYPDPEIKVVFPAEIASFRKQEVIRSYNPLIGTAVRYADDNGNCADIYIYTSWEENGTFEQHFQSAKKAVLDLPTKGFSVKKVSLLKDLEIQFTPENTGKRAEFLITFSEDDSQVFSFLQLFLYREKIIKIRLSCDEKSANEFFGKVQKLFFP